MAVGTRGLQNKMTYLVYNFSSIICQLCDFGDMFPLLFLFLGGGILMKLLEIIIKFVTVTIFTNTIIMALKL